MEPDEIVCYVAFHLLLHCISPHLVILTVYKETYKHSGSAVKCWNQGRGLQVRSSLEALRLPNAIVFEQDTLILLDPIHQ